MNVFNINASISRFAKQLDETNALLAFNMLNRYGLKPNYNTYLIMINMYTKLSVALENTNYYILEVENWFNKMLNDKMTLSIRCFNCIIWMFSKLGKINDVLTWLHIAKYNYNLEPDNYTYCIIIDTYSKAKQPELALKWYNEMPNPDRITTNTILDMYAKLKDADNAMELYNKMKNPDVYTFTILIDMWGKMKNINEVHKLYDQMLKLKIQPTSSTHTVMMRGLTSWEKIMYHNNILEQTNNLTNASLSVFLDSCGFNNQLEIAIEFWNRVILTHYHLFSANTYTSMIEACGRCGDHIKGSEILEDFENSPLCLTSTQTEIDKIYTTYQTQISY